jgi:hypothetical protein
MLYNGNRSAEDDEDDESSSDEEGAALFMVLGVFEGAENDGVVSFSKFGSSRKVK